jgi:hypothetical protein
VVRTGSDGTISRQPVGSIGPEHTVNLAVEQFTERDESVPERSITVISWTGAIKS